MHLYKTAILLKIAVYTLSGLTGSAIPVDACSSPGCCNKSLAICRPRTKQYTWSSVEFREGGTAHDGGGCDQSIGSTVSDANVRC